MSGREPIGDLVDSLGVAHEPREGELAVSAIVLLKVVDDDGRVSMRVAWSDGLAFIERVGMYRCAERLDLPPSGGDWDDD